MCRSQQIIYGLLINGPLSVRPQSLHHTITIQYIHRLVSVQTRCVCRFAGLKLEAKLNSLSKNLHPLNAAGSLWSDLVFIHPLIWNVHRHLPGLLLLPKSIKPAIHGLISSKSRIGEFIKKFYGRGCEGGFRYYTYRIAQPTEQTKTLPQLITKLVN